jgi:hypothetical protein
MHAKKCMDEFGRERLPADLVQYLEALAKYVRYYMQRKRLQLVVKHMKLERRKRLYGNPLRIMMLFTESFKGWSPRISYFEKYLMASLISLMSDAVYLSGCVDGYGRP